MLKSILVKFKKFGYGLLVVIMLIAFFVFPIITCEEVCTDVEYETPIQTECILKEPVMKEEFIFDDTSEPLNVNVIEEPKPITPEVSEDIYTLTDDEINLIALVTMAEAEDEPEEGKRLVIDTILNRVDSSTWPGDVYGVIYQAHQFSSMWNGRVDRCYVMDDIVTLVHEELKSRTNYDVVFFTADDYGKYGTPMFSIGNHYFCSCE